VKFHLSTVLTVTTGFFVARDGLEEVYAIPNFLTGDSLFTHQLPRAGKQCTPALLFQHPLLQTVDSDVLRERLKGVELREERKRLCAEWVGEQIPILGEWLDVQPLNSYTPVDPIKELAGMVSPDKILVVQAGEKQA